MILNPLDEHRDVHTSVYMAETVTFEDYKRYIRHFCYSELGGRRTLVLVLIGRHLPEHIIGAEKLVIKKTDILQKTSKSRTWNIITT